MTFSTEPITEPPPARVVPAYTAAPVAPPAAPWAYGRRALAVTLALCALLVLARVPFLGAVRRDVPVDLDEFETASVALDALVGTPPGKLHWPLGVVRYFACAKVAVQTVVDTGGRPTPRAFVETLGRTLRDPQQGAYELRWFTAIVSSAGIALLFGPVARISGSVLAGVLVVVAIAALPSAMARCAMATCDGPAWGLGCAALAVAAEARGRGGRVAVAAALMGAAVGTRIMAVYFAPAVLLLAVADCGRRRRAVELARGAAVAAAANLVVNPYTLTDPLRTAKALVGHVLFREGDRGLAAFVKALSIGITPWVGLLGVVAVAALCAQRRWLVALGVTLGCGVCLASAARSAAPTEHYFVPVGALLLFAAGLAFGPALARAHVAAKVAVVLLVAAHVGWGLHAVGEYRRERADRYRPMREAAQIAREYGPDAKLYLCGSATTFLGRDTSSASQGRLALRVEEAIRQRTVTRWLKQSANVPEDIAAALYPHFSEDEQTAAASFRLIATARVAGLDVTPVNSAAADPFNRFGLTTPAEAFAAFDRGEADVLMLDAPDARLPFRRPDALLGDDRSPFRIAVFRKK